MGILPKEQFPSLYFMVILSIVSYRIFIPFQYRDKAVSRTSHHNLRVRSPIAVDHMQTVLYIAAVTPWEVPDPAQNAAKITCQAF